MSGAIIECPQLLSLLCGARSSRSRNIDFPLYEAGMSADPVSGRITPEVVFGDVIMIGPLRISQDRNAGRSCFLLSA
jgi:hypothetical protein